MDIIDLNISSVIVKHFMHDDDCVQSGCPGHDMVLNTNGVSNTTSLYIDNKLIYTFDTAMISSLNHLINTIKTLE